MGLVWKSTVVAAIGVATTACGEINLASKVIEAVVVPLSKAHCVDHQTNFYYVSPYSSCLGSDQKITREEYEVGWRASTPSIAASGTATPAPRTGWTYCFAPRGNFYYSPPSSSCFEGDQQVTREGYGIGIRTSTPSSPIVAPGTKGSVTYCLDPRGEVYYSVLDRSCFDGDQTRQAYSTQILSTTVMSADSPSAPSAVRSSAPASDRTPPIITVADSLQTATDSIEISGRVSDDSRVASLAIAGGPIPVAADGTFRVSRYVPPGGDTLRIEAIDEWNNRAEKTVQISRQARQAAVTATVERLNPTRVRARPNPDAVALIVGVANYSRAPKASYADNDAQVFADYARRALGVPDDNIKVLVNDQASLVEFKLALKRWLRGRAMSERADLYIFFAGHGLASPDGKDLYLLPYDGEPSLLADSALRRSELIDDIVAVRPRSATLFLDTCYSGSTRGGTVLLASIRPVFIVPKPEPVPQAIAVVTAASGEQVSGALDEAGHGLFSYFLMKGLEGEADSNRDRSITLGELHAYLAQNVERQALRLGRKQTPELLGASNQVLMSW